MGHHLHTNTHQSHNILPQVGV
uniref:Uncharacterized protein n=1 Tax=Rhizophora mucronata TaxID=61149 RepID=A0A2P2PQM9_RHIMU